MGSISSRAMSRSHAYHEGIWIFRDCSYYIYSDDIRFQPTEIQFMGEYFYSVARGIFPPSARYEILTKAGLLEMICVLGQQDCFIEYHSTRQNDVCKEILLYIQNHYPSTDRFRPPLSTRRISTSSCQ